MKSQWFDKIEAYFSLAGNPVDGSRESEGRTLLHSRSGCKKSHQEWKKRMGDHACRLLWSRHRKGTHHFRLLSTDQSPSTMLPPPLPPPPPLCHICWTQSVPGHSPRRHLLPSIHLTLWMDSHKQCLPWIK